MIFFKGWDVWLATANYILVVIQIIMMTEEGRTVGVLLDCKKLPQ